MLKRTLLMAATFLGFLNIKEIPIVDGKVAFSDDQTDQLKAELSEEVLQQAIDAFNKDIEENAEVVGISNQIKEMLASMETPEQAAANKAKQKEPGANDDGLDVNAQLAALKTKMKERDELITTLLASAEEDTPIERILNSQAKEMIKHSATHLYSSGKQYDAIEGRNWNQLAVGKSTSATDWTASEGLNISKLNGDMELFFKENPDVVKSLHRDNFGLPKHWKKKTNVVDRINSGSIATAEISQSRKLPWLPKNNQTIQAEEGKIYPISIDIEFVGHFLQEIEASWLSNYNKEGSQAYKHTFVRFLVAELDKRARLEDRIATMKGVYVPTPDDATTAGRFINRQNGLLYWLWKARDLDKKYRAFNIGTPTSANIVDYVDTLLKSLPLEVRTSTGLELDISPAWLKAYKTRTEMLFGGNNDYTGYPTAPKNFPNIKFVENVDLEGSDFMFVTYSDNIEILENVPKEKSMYHFEYALRKIYAFADYKLGIRLVHIGNKVKAGDPAEFKVQTVWSNNVPIFDNEFFAPVFDDTTGEIEATFNQLKVAANFKTDITKITGLAPGIIFKIQGDANLTVSKAVKKNTDLLLASDFALDNGGTLTCIVQADGKLKELSRTTAPVTTPTTNVVEFEDGSLDAEEGNEFNYVGTSAVTVTEILNGVPAQQLKITGKAGASSDVTIASAATISVASNAVLATDNDFIELVFVDGKWTEFNRVINP
ncbi:hypothetical protein [Tenacibaculum soleae]|uniref:hypothetical protein n=1 Tax=Tenacibaculum soleae TaxID=447689 RepID=UPI002300FF11|nr:hypothetical protein [Tenacibaculum soleae]